jgi:hypothetical protein
MSEACRRWLISRQGCSGSPEPGHLQSFNRGGNPGQQISLIFPQGGGGR